MEYKLKLFVVLMRISKKLYEQLPQMRAFSPEAKGKFHIDAWHIITNVHNYFIEIIDRTAFTEGENHLYFLNIGDFKPNNFEEYHYKILTVSTKMSSAIRSAKKKSFYRYCSFAGAISQIDEKFSIEVNNNI